MRVRAALPVIGLVMLAACSTTVDPERAAQACEERARAAQGPTGEMTFGVNSQTGSFAGASIALSSDFLTGKDPVEVYENCVFQRTGMAPIRPPVLRRM
ncbi:MAG: hypothetical protein JJ872_10095 [Marivivens sp.]|jgi:hypothetical protein|nr:hypothetical protein [Marivivens sp.]